MSDAPDMLLHKTPCHQSTAETVRCSRHLKETALLHLKRLALKSALAAGALVGNVPLEYRYELPGVDRR